jgi:hypothetical protein
MTTDASAMKVVKDKWRRTIMGLRLRRYHPFWHDQSAPNAAVADKRLTSLTLAADTFSSLAVSRTPRPSSNAERIRCTWNGVVLGLPRRLPDDLARSSPATPGHGSSPARIR